MTSSRPDPEQARRDDSERSLLDEPLNELPRKAFARGIKLASLPVGFAGRTALGLGRRIGGRSAEEVAAQVQARTAEQLFSVLGQLKGGAMKVGQAMSIFEAALPDELARPYRATLTKLQDSTPAMPRPTVESVLRAELGEQWQTRFVDFDFEPVAAASIGQVHRAVWRGDGGQPGGREVAVKLQYPGAAQALLSDFTQLARVAKLAGAIMPGMDLGPVLAELRERLSEEVDYRLEAGYQHEFATAFAGDPHFLVPDVVFHTERVLVSDWVTGSPLSALIVAGSQAERDAASARYLEFLLAGPERAGLLHADPHPGNFRLAADGRMIVVDFGAVNRLPGGMPPIIGELLTIAMTTGPERIDPQVAARVLAGLRDTGFVRASIDLDAVALLGFLQPFLRPLRTPTFTFDRPWLRELFAHVNDPRRTSWAVGMKLNLPPAYLLIHRVWSGGLGVLCQLGGQVAAREVLAAHLPGYRPDPGRQGAPGDR